MSKRQRSKKKRTKPYSGNDAAGRQPVIRRYSAEIKSPAREWWDAKKGPLKLIGGVAAGGTFLVWLLAEAIHTIF